MCLCHLSPVQHLFVCSLLLLCAALLCCDLCQMCVTVSVSCLVPFCVFIACPVSRSSVCQVCVSLLFITFVFVHLLSTETVCVSNERRSCSRPHLGENTVVESVFVVAHDTPSLALGLAFPPSFRAFSFSVLPTRRSQAPRVHLTLYLIHILVRRCRARGRLRARGVGEANDASAKRGLAAHVVRMWR